MNVMTIALSAAILGGFIISAALGADEKVIPTDAMGLPSVSSQISQGTEIQSSFLEAFERPAESAKPWVYWYWINGNISREGITRDLEAMARCGIGGAYLFSIGGIEKGKTFVEKPVTSLSPEWWSMVDHALHEADRLGMRIACNACDGWATAGGPWITPENSMQTLVWSQIQVANGQSGPLKLPQPTTRKNYYRDLAVIAFPGHERTSTQAKPRISTSFADVDAHELVTDTKEFIFPKAGWLQFSFDQPFTMRSLNIKEAFHFKAQIGALNQADVQISDDGQTFTSVGRLEPNRVFGWQDTFGVDASPALPKPTITAKHFRFVFDAMVTIRQIELSDLPRIPEWQGKAGFRWRSPLPSTVGRIADSNCIPRERIIDLSKQLRPDGSLDWTPPPGDWMVQRFGMTSTAVQNGCGGAGTGLESDKFNPAATEIQYRGWYGEMVKRAGPTLAGRTLAMNHVDSWEAWCQNWSPVFREQFRARRGYDPVSWLPAMTGVPIASAELTERFLHDVRRTLADLVNEAFFRPMVRLTHQDGGRFSAECVQNTMMCEGLEYYREVDVPMGEFWYRTPYPCDKPNDIVDAVSAGHIYGKRIIQAEAFTAGQIRWNETPFLLKSEGDFNIAKGINRLVLHVWAHQATNQRPGVTLWQVGTFFSGHQTWIEPARAWVDYLRRTQSVLQHGLPVADAAYLINERLPSRAFMREGLTPDLPDGYQFDSINGDALINRAQATNGHLVMPDGVSYRMLVIPDAAGMSPKLAQAVARIAAAGVPVIANTKPAVPVGLEGYPEADRHLSSLVAKEWGPVMIGATPADVLKKMHLEPDVEFPGVDLKPIYRKEFHYTSSALVWNHRRAGDEDVYFVSNQEPNPRTVTALFRIAGRIPELWYPDLGRRCDATTWRREGERTSVALTLDAFGSCLVVFRRPTNGLATSPTTPAPSTASHPITEPWRVTFPPALGAPDHMEMAVLQPLENHSEAGIRYFAGTATYSCSFTVPPGALKASSVHRIDLGVVANLAEVTLNDREVGIAWKPPYRVGVTGVLREGINHLVVKVSNTWRNRLIGDRLLPEADRIAKTPVYKDWPISDKDTLSPSGLIGPVSWQDGDLIP